ncbi:hypothetical protein PUN28_014125 [Cardiocondyla obscurior]|uniref:Uncharacterized protein n=1 Tax=Cardiocondyla obscurior TaxID=286306 RepID=A0AAW2F0P5_9HYME
MNEKCLNLSGTASGINFGLRQAIISRCSILIAPIDPTRCDKDQTEMLEASCWRIAARVPLKLKAEADGIPEGPPPQKLINFANGLGRDRH